MTRPPTGDHGGGGVPYALASHFLRKLAFAAPANGLPFLSTALGSHASFLHFVRKAVLAAPARGLPVLLTAYVAQVASCAIAELRVKIESATARTKCFMTHSIFPTLRVSCATQYELGMTGQGRLSREDHIVYAVPEFIWEMSANWRTSRK